MGINKQQIEDRFAVYNGDCMQVMPDMPDASIGFSVYSPPFPELYQYSNDPRDMSNCTTYEEGLEHYRFVINEIHRLTKPGRLTAVHCMDLKQGQLYQRDFPGDIVRMHEDAGFHYFCRITIWKDPWIIARRTRMRSLMHKTIVNDSSRCRVAGGDYVVVFRKGGENPDPVTHENGFRDYAGETQIPEELLRFRKFTGDQRKNLLSHWIWRNYASPVWSDIRAGRLMPYEEARENEDEKHVCPLQLDVIERCLMLWSNPGDTVLTPFMGVGSEVYCSLINDRRAVGVELKETYYDQALRNIRKADVTTTQDELSLFESEEDPDCDIDDEDESDDDVPTLDISRHAEKNGALVGPVAKVVNDDDDNETNERD